MAFVHQGSYRMGLGKLPGSAQRGNAVLFRSQAAVGRSRVCKGSLVVHANYANLESWQIGKLQKAYMQGRKKIKIKELAQNVNLPRKVVLDWMKEFDALEPSRRESILEARQAHSEALQERREALFSDKTVEEDITSDWRSYMSPRERVASMMMDKPLNKATIATLEKVFQTIRYPDEAVLRDLFEIHKIPRKRAIKWFQDQRDKDARRHRRSMHRSNPIDKYEDTEWEFEERDI